MSSLYKRATPSQARILRAVEGAVKNACDAHPGKYNFDRRVARSIAKRATGTISAQWPELLAAQQMPSGWYATKFNEWGTGSAPREQGADPGSALTHPRADRRLTVGLGPTGDERHSFKRRSSLARIWGQLGKMIGEAKRSGQHERAAVLIEAIKVVHAEQHYSVE